jgi:hypothetical protein
LPRSQSRRTPEAIDDTMIVLPGAHQLLPNIARWHSMVPTVVRGLLEASVERVEAQVDEMPHDDGLRIQGHHHTRPFLSKLSPSATRKFIPSE